MYILLFLSLLALGVATMRSGLILERRGRARGGGLIIAATFLFFALLSFWGEMVWFDAVGFAHRFWMVVGIKALLMALGALVAAGATLALTAFTPLPRWLRLLTLAGAGILGALWAASHWTVVMKFLERVDTGVVDPIHGRDAGFYLFALPFYDAVFWMLLGIAGLSFSLALLSQLATRGEAWAGGISFPATVPPPAASGLFVPAAALAFVLAWGSYLGVYHLLYSTWGVVAGPGWADVHVRLPGFLVVAVVLAALGLSLLIPAVRRRLAFRSLPTRREELRVLASVVYVGVIVWITSLAIVPALVQWLVVEPNEITFETPYIAHNIEFTRRGFRLDQVEEREFPMSGEFTREVARANENVLSEIRLWDWRALDAVFKQFQEIRLYYEFFDVDIDRYQIGERYRQVMVSAREMSLQNFPRQSQTFVNQRLKYTHGYGIGMTTVSDFTSAGLPNMVVKDIPPKTEHPELEVHRPEIYYGELTTSPAVVNTREEEFDYPRGDENVFVRYDGKGGVALDNLWRKFVFGWKFDGTRFLLSTYPTPETRVMIHRNVRERVETIAPFLDFDDDPYVVLAEGQLYWIVDGYTTSRYYPYSEPFSARERIEYRDGTTPKAVAGEAATHLGGVNYVRNSVKAVVNAFDGAVAFYVFDPDDPIVRVWQRVFPELFRSREDMPESLEAHVRYPVDFLLAQGIVYAKYHMTDPAVFYNQEDLWVRATEKYYAAVQPVRPYYVMWQMPGADAAEFVLIQPFTPKNRQVLIGWIAGMCDRDNYGRFLAYKFPKEKRILGPQQVETKIDQDRFLSGQLTLWDQRGSKVIRGNVLAIPIGDTLIYVEPIYLQAETAAYPELRLVVVMHGDRISYAEGFEDALNGIFEDEGRAPAITELGPEGVGWREWAHRAEQAFDEYLRALGEERFDDAGQALERLRESVRELGRQSET